MDIYYRSRKLQKTCDSQPESNRVWGDQIAAVVRRRLKELAAAATLAEVSHLPPARCHQLVGNRAGQFAVDLKHPHRLVFEIAHDPVPRRPDGGIDLARVTAVVILAVEDYHG